MAIEESIYVDAYCAISALHVRLCKCALMQAYFIYLAVYFGVCHFVHWLLRLSDGCFVYILLWGGRKSVKIYYIYYIYFTSIDECNGFIQSSIHAWIDIKYGNSFIYFHCSSFWNGRSDILAGLGLGLALYDGRPVPVDSMVRCHNSIPFAILQLGSPLVSVSWKQCYMTSFISFILLLI